MIKNLFVLLLVVLSTLNTDTQNIDSLKQGLATAQEDTNKVKIMFALYYNYKYNTTKPSPNAILVGVF
ncbi:MAG: hypothetical protein ABI760_18025 [Ferruginibacter sp.]